MSFEIQKCNSRIVTIAAYSSSDFIAERLLFIYNL